MKKHCGKYCLTRESKIIILYHSLLLIRSRYMTLTLGELARIDEINKKFFDNLNARLTNAGYFKLCPAVESFIKDEYIDIIKPLDDSEHETIKNGLEPYIFHRTPDKVKAYTDYAQANYNIYLYLGWMLLRFFNNPYLHPKVKRIDNIDFVVAPLTTGAPFSLPDYFKRCKRGDEGKKKQDKFRSISGWDFLGGGILDKSKINKTGKQNKRRTFSSISGSGDFLGANILNEFNLKVADGYNMPVEELYYSFYMAWEPESGIFSISKLLDTVALGKDFLEQITTKELKYMFHKFNRKDTKKVKYYYTERIHEYKYDMKNTFSANVEDGNIYELCELVSKLRPMALKKIDRKFYPDAYKLSPNEEDNVRENEVSFNTPVAGDFTFENILEADENDQPERKYQYSVDKEERARKDEELFLFFEVSFERDDPKLCNDLRNYLERDRDAFRKGFHKFICDKKLGATEFGKLYAAYAASNTTDIYSSTEFNIKIREAADSWLTEHLIYCGCEGVKCIYKYYFNTNDKYDQDFLKYVKSKIDTFFKDFKEEMKDLAKSFNIDEKCMDKFPDFYRNRFTLPPPRNPELPSINEVDLRERIDKTAEKSFGKLRNEYLMYFPYHRDQWEKIFFKEYCKGNRKMLADIALWGKFRARLDKISIDILTYYNQETENNG
jgi:hypothetical protein